MEVKIVTAQEYETLFSKPCCVYNSVRFSELNGWKCDMIHYLLFKEENGKVRFGMVIGDDGKRLKSPFSAPFGGLEVRGCQRLEHYLEAFTALKNFILNLGRSLIITLPPEFYCSHSHVQKQSIAMKACGYDLGYSDIDYYFPAGLSVEGLRERMWSEARNKLTNALKAGFVIEGCKSDDADSEPMICRVYNVIRGNREWKGYPLRMSMDEVMRTVEIVPADFITVTLDGVDVAAAMLYHVTDRVVQVIYWGDKPGYSKFRPMNFLAEKVVELYSGNGKIIDIGPSSSGGVPSTGLCNFKESIGCSAALKSTYFFGRRT